MEHLANIDPWIALGVIAATMLTDAVCVLYTSSVVHRRDLGAANWASLTYMLSAFAVISFTNNWTYVMFAALGAWTGTYASMKYLRWRSACATQGDCVGVVHAVAAVEPTSELVVACARQPLTPATFPAEARIAA
jgi:hypothetical protein